jgi:DNA-binding MarR family transcriptional regulator/GNAT superfamily N-acetyltransferase
LLENAMTDLDSIRAATREIVRELGFMGGKFAGTDLSPSAVHALIEIEAGDITARDLSARLRLEKSTISRMLRKLVETGVVGEQAGDDGRAKVLSLTSSGQQQVAAIHAFGRAQVSDALAHLAPGQKQAATDGLNLYAAALAARSGPLDQQGLAEIGNGYRTGLIGRVTQMHALYYARASGFGRQFESVVAGGLAEFCARLDRPRNAIWTAVQGQKTVGSIAIDGEDLGANTAHLRWFIVDDDARGSGTGRRLLSTALGFVDEQDFAETHLWTFSGLHAARHLYESHGFSLAEERRGTQWGSEVLEQRFVRKHV